MNIHIEKRGFFISAIVFALFLFAVAVYAYTSVPNPGHGANSVVVTVGNAEMTLQEAIDQSKLGGTGNIINGSGIVFSTVNGKTMINVTANLVTPIYSCPKEAVSSSCLSGSTYPACQGQLSTSSKCNYAYGVDSNCPREQICTLLGYLVQ